MLSLGDCHAAAPNIKRQSEFMEAELAKNPENWCESLKTLLGLFACDCHLGVMHKG